MAQTLVRVLVHLIFSTKERANIIRPDVESELHAYLAGIANNLDSPCLAVNGTSDHVHMLVSQSKNLALAKLVEEVKKGSSKWIKTKSAALCGFHWQDGYAAFSVSQSKALAVERYILKQKEHTARGRSRKRLIQFLRRYG
jgi:putative transposase